jgi:hypothetical protein
MSLNALPLMLTVGFTLGGTTCFSRVCRSPKPSSIVISRCASPTLQMDVPSAASIPPAHLPRPSRRE